MKRQSRQAGFSIVEAVIAVVAIGVIGTAGFFVYQHNRPKTTGATGTTNPPTNQQTGTTPPTNTTYFTISEWGVRAPYSGSLKLSYTIATDSTGNSSATFSSDQLTALSTDCTGRGGSIIRWAAGTKYAEGTSDANTPTVATYFQGKDAKAYNYAHIGNYYYTFAHDQAACGDLTSTAETQSQTNDAVKALVANLQTIPN